MDGEPDGQGIHFPLWFCRPHCKGARQLLRDLFPGGGHITHDWDGPKRSPVQQSVPCAPKPQHLPSPPAGVT